MRYEAHLSAYDALDRVMVGLTVWDTTRPGAGLTDPDYVIATVLVSEGISDVREWSRDALLGLIERI